MAIEIDSIVNREDRSHQGTDVITELKLWVISCELAKARDVFGLSTAVVGWAQPWRKEWEGYSSADSTRGVSACIVDDRWLG